ncbi:twin-arginine translocation signal domain-containing protein [Candidatus Persebacteraceae bacterium Df01]|uniref:Twin-arginine translocation signal domain-containing protein n=1 Tax=Candidatus Doriopsillibacter californiensis TaxID=2970740 RepID=A0ABT7QMR0_9GAMM|nr:twin-arginine translocation signal domain-containing protein [Candidatus Persebacteraceae bacterium Df01]
MKKNIRQTSETDKEAISRRGFLKAALLSGGAASVVSGEAVAAGRLSTLPEAKKHQGYRETEHIRRYYDSARRV